MVDGFIIKILKMVVLNTYDANAAITTLFQYLFKQLVIHTKAFERYSSILVKLLYGSNRFYNSIVKHRTIWHDYFMTEEINNFNKEKDRSNK